MSSARWGIFYSNLKQFRSIKVISSVLFTTNFVTGIVFGWECYARKVLWQEKYRAVEETFWQEKFHICGGKFCKWLPIIWSSFKYLALLSETTSFLHTEYFQFSCLLNVPHQSSSPELFYLFNEQWRLFQNWKGKRWRGGYRIKVREVLDLFRNKNIQV